MFTNLNMKKLVLWLFVIMVCTFAAAGAIQMTSGFEGSLFTGSWNERSNNTTPVDISKSFSMDGIKSIRVNTISEDINVIPSDSKEIKVHLSGKWDDTVNLNTNQAGDSLDIKLEHKPVFGINFSPISLKLDVYIPKEYAESFSASTVSAELGIKDLNFKDFKYNSVSGELKASGIEAANTEIHTTSGAALLENFGGSLSFSSVSGDLDARYASYENNDIEIHTTSGRSKIKLPENSQFSVKFTTTSGNLDCDFPITTTGSSAGHNVKGTVGTGGGSITGSSVSGDMVIYK